MRWLACVVLCSGCDLVFELREPGSTFDAAACGPQFAMGARHVFVDELVAWFTAEAACEAMDPDPTDGTFVHLTVVSNIGELSELAQLGPPSGMSDLSWVGLTNGRLETNMRPPTSEEFEWITLEKTIDVPWKPTDPDSNTEGTLGGAFDHGESLLNDSGSPHSYICECDGFAPVPDRIIPRQ